MSSPSSFFFYGALARFLTMDSPTFFLQPLPLAAAESGLGWLHPSVCHLIIYFVVYSLAFLQNSFLVPSLGYDVVPFLQRDQPTLVSLNVCMLKGSLLVHFIDLIVVPNPQHSLGLGGPNIFRRIFLSMKSILFAAPWERVHTSLSYINIPRISVRIVLLELSN
jgi:hypothetical protein